MKRHIVTGSFLEPINDIIARAGIETRGDTWIYKGLSVTRPNDGNWRKKIRLEFDIYIRLRNEK